jgi:hypothetical protein
VYFSIALIQISIFGNSATTITQAIINANTMENGSTLTGTKTMELLMLICHGLQALRLMASGGGVNQASNLKTEKFQRL